MNEKDLKKLEIRICNKMSKIENSEISTKDSGIGKDLNLLKRIDEPTYDVLMVKYKSILNLLK